MPETSSLPSPNGGDLLLALMDELDVDTAFGVVSVHNLPLIDAVERHRRFVPVRHEAAVVNAADAYGRATGNIGIAITSTGTGAGNAAGSVIEALSAGASVLHVTGQIESQYLGQGRGFIHETRDQLGMLTAISKSAYSIDSTTTAAQILQTACSHALSTPTGPVSVEWPIDLQYAVHENHAMAVAPAQAPRADTTSVTEAASMIERAQRPVVWAGGGARNAGTQLEALLNTTRAGLVTSNAGRGVVHEGHGSCIGNFATSAACKEILADADLLISIGTHFRSNETADYAIKLPENHIQIDADPAAIGRVYSAHLGLVGDAAATLDDLVTQLPARTSTDEDWLARVASARRQVRLHLRESIGWQSDICNAVQSALPPTAVIARDVTIPSSTWGNRLLSMVDPRCNIFPRGGGIGQGLAMAIGAAITQPELPTLALVGDGGLAVHLGELATLAQERPWVLVLLYNDSGYGVLRNTQDAYTQHRAGVDLATPDFSLLSSSMGLPHWRVGGIDEIEEALASALDTRGPAVVEIDVAAMGPMPQPFTPPVKLPQS